MAASSPPVLTLKVWWTLIQAVFIVLCFVDRTAW
jgi:hypothetical protein